MNHQASVAASVVRQQQQQQQQQRRQLGLSDYVNSGTHMVRTAANSLSSVYKQEARVMHNVANSAPVRWTEREMLSVDNALFSRHPQARYAVGAVMGGLFVSSVMSRLPSRS